MTLIALLVWFSASRLEAWAKCAKLALYEELHRPPQNVYMLIGLLRHAVIEWAF